LGLEKTDPVWKHIPSNALAGPQRGWHLTAAVPDSLSNQIPSVCAAQLKVKTPTSDWRAANAFLQGKPNPNCSLFPRFKKYHHCRS